MASTFNEGENVFVGSSIYPAKFVRLVDDVTVEVEWPESGGTTWERFYPLEKVKPMSGGRRQRKKADFFTENESLKKKIKVEPNGKAAAVKKNGTTSNARKLQVIKKESIKKKPISRAEAPVQAYQASQILNKQQKPRRRTLTTASKKIMNHAVSDVARKPKELYFSCEIDSDSFSDDSLFAEARAVRQGRYLSSSNDDDDDDRKHAAKPEGYSSDSSDDALDLARTRARQDWNTSLSSSDNDTWSERKPAAKPTKRQKEYPSEESSYNEQDSAEMRESFGSSSDSSVDDDTSEFELDKASYDESDSVSLQESRPIVKTEPNAPPQTRSLIVGDHVYVRDGAKGEHGAVVTNVMGDWLEVRWDYRRSGDNNIVAKSAVTLMFDLTASVESGRQRRNTRARMQRMLPGAMTDNKVQARRKIARKEEKSAPLSTRKPKKKKAAGKPKKKRAVTAKDAFVADVTEEASIESNDSELSDATNIDLTRLLDSSDSEKDAESLTTEATFEYTAPSVDPRYRSLHVVANLESFMDIEPWKQNLNIDHDEQKDAACSNAERDMGFALKAHPNTSRMSCSGSVFEKDEEQGHAHSKDCARLCEETPRRLDIEYHATDGKAMDGKACRPFAFASFSSGVERRALRLDSCDEEQSHRQSTDCKSRRAPRHSPIV